MKSIRTKLFIFLIALMVIYMIIGITLNLFLLKPYYMQQNKHFFQNISQQINNHENADITEIANNMGVLITITDKQFKILYSSNNINNKLLPEDIVSSILAKENQKEPIYTTSKGQNSISKLVYMQWINHNKRLVITKSISVIDDSVNIANDFYIVTSIFVFIIGGIAIFIFSKTLTNPIITISKIAHEISELNFDKKIVVKSKDELGTLANSINKLSDSLKQSLQNLKKDISFEKTLSRNLSHQLKTPVAIIKGHAEGIMYSIVSTPEDQKKYLKVIVTECDRMNNLVKEMLTLSKLSIYEKSNIDFKLFDCKLICSYIESRFQSIFVKNNIKFSSDGDILINGNIDLINHAISNYVSNAVKHSTGNITLKFYKNSDFYIISVFNSGENICENQLTHIFEPFYKLDYSRTNNEEGHGLGLAIVNSIANIHNGKAYAQNMNNGVNFILEIPIL